MCTVSVIIPNYNHARYLRKRIESVMEQTYLDFEVILLDDCSIDDSRQIISEYEKDPRVRIEFNERNSGSTFKQWNKGVGLARGKYVWIAESDDYAAPRLLERLVSVLEKQPEVTLAYCRSWCVRDDGTRDGYFDTYLDCFDRMRWTADFIIDGIEECRDSLLLCNTVPNASAVLFRKSTFERLGGADERLRICGDYKLWMGMALNGSIAFVAEPLNYFRHHNQNTHLTSGGVLPFLEHFYVVRWLLKRLSGEKRLQDPRTVSDELPPVTNSLEQFRRCHALVDGLEASIRMVNPGRLPEIVRAFWHYRLILNEREFEVFAPGRWRYFSFRCALYRHQFASGSWKRRLFDLIHLFEAFLGGYRNRCWLGSKFAPLKQRLRTLAHR